MEYKLIVLIIMNILAVFSSVVTSTSSYSCGVAPEVEDELRIVGGSVTSATDNPWFVALTQRKADGILDVNCGASLISPTHVLTAAHCYYQHPESFRTKVYMLAYLLENRCNPHTAIWEPQAIKVDVHENYDPVDTSNDIALITLAFKVDLTPICLPAPGKAVKFAEGEVIGFGWDMPRDAFGQYPCQMNSVILPILSMKECLATRVRQYVKPLHGIFCAGRSPGEDSCDGDSGGPFQVVDNGKYTIKGIVSFGLGCARRNMPGVYTEVSSHLRWISHKSGGVVA